MTPTLGLRYKGEMVSFAPVIDLVELRGKLFNDRLPTMQLTSACHENKQHLPTFYEVVTPF